MMINLQYIKKSKVRNDTKIEIVFEIENKPEKIWFRYKTIPQLNFDAQNANAFVSFVLLPAMKLGQDINLNSHLLSQSLSSNLDLLQDRYLQLFPEQGLKKIKLVNFKSKIFTDKNNDKKTAAFFTCGVDSFDTLINDFNCNNKISELIYVYGFDVRYGDRNLFETVERSIIKVSNHFKKNAIFITTNLREFTEQYLNWDIVHGAALVSIGYLLENYLSILLIPGSNSVGQLAPNGSHPLLEPLFSSEKIKFIYDRQEKKRIEKIEVISKSKIALQNLRVCWKNAGNKLNCGSCEKCVRTMLGLEIFNVLNQSKSFAKILDEKALDSIKFTNDGIAFLYKEMLPYLKEKPVLIEAKKQILLELKGLDEKKKTDKTLPLYKKKKNILFIDFNGVISYQPFWLSLKNNQSYSNYYQSIENYLFKENKKIIIDWMVGVYSSEEIHEILKKQLGSAGVDVFSVFKEDCKKIDISLPILSKIVELRKYYYCILATDNMDSFTRFTLPHHKELIESFDEINDSYTMKQYKSSFGGVYFKNKIMQKEAVIENSILIDDSLNNCNVFKSIGGQAYLTKNEKDVLNTLSDLQSRVESKWEWQY